MLLTLMSKLSQFAIVLLAISCAGCGGPPEAPTGTLKGTVKSGGEICGNCMISIADAKTLVRRGGNVDESGSFELKEIPFGEYQVRVVQTPSNLDVNVVDDRIPKKYHRLGTSGLSASITSIEPVTLDIDME